MKYLLDTCIISETHKRVPSAQLMDWLSRVVDGDLYISAITIGELRKGARSARDIAQQTALERWIDGVVLPMFDDKIISVNAAVADKWGRLMGDGVAKGCTPSVIDSIIAATALAHGMTMVTRNVADFQFEGLEVVNPFEKV